MALLGEASIAADRISRSSRAPTRPAGFLVLIAAAIVAPLAFFSVGASSAWNAAQEDATVSLDRVTTMLQEHALRAFETHEALMTALDYRLEAIPSSSAPGQRAELKAYLSALRRSAPPVAGLAILDADGRLVAGDVRGDAMPPDLESRQVMDQLRRQSRRVTVGSSMRSADGATRYFAVFRRRLNALDEDNGFVVSLFDAAFFESFYAPLRRERGDVIALLREDGEALAQVRVEAGPGDGDDEAAQILSRAHGLNATIRTSLGLGRPDKLYMVRRIGDYPVFLVEGRSLSGVQQQWLIRVAPYALLLITCTAFMLLLIWWMAQATRREQMAYARLAAEEAEHAAELAANVRMKRLMDANVFGVVTFTDKGMVEANDAFLVMIGKSRMAFKAQGFCWRTRTGADLGRDEYIRTQLLRRGSCPPFETEIMLGDTQSIPVLIGATLYDRDPLTWTCFVLDLTERQEREAQQIFVMRELNHRTKNLLTVIRSIAGQIARTGAGWDDFRDRFNSRLAALASAHDLLVDSNWRGASLAGLIRSQSLQFHDMTTGQITIEGEDLNLSPRAAQAIGMALYELMTNAAKYGALSTPAGRIRIDWTIECADEESSFHLEWREQGGPPVPAPTHRGFGHIVIAEMTARSLQGDVVYTFAPEGVIWRLTAPLDAVREQEGAEATDAIRAA